MGGQSRICTRCGTACTDACPTCTAWWHQRPDASGMSAEERAAEFDSWGPVLEIDFGKFHQRMEELVGRPVWTHEFARPELLRHEIATNTHPTMEGVVAKLPPDKPVIVVTDDES
jgi:hypothetical protein